MESGYRMERLTHFAHPQHQLVKTQYERSAQRHVCHICEVEIANLGYRCNTCGNFDIHEACATYFKEDISFFAHPWHALTLARTIDVRVCDLCREPCPVGTFMYRCAHCAFDVHPLCTLLPQTIRSPLHPAHELNMVPAKGDCAACRRDCSVWHYRCGLCLYNLHIGCVHGSGAPPGGGDGHSNTTGGRD